MEGNILEKKQAKAQVFTCQFYILTVKYQLYNGYAMGREWSMHVENLNAHNVLVLKPEGK
jgi:hypothetical protein